MFSLCLGSCMSLFSLVSQSKVSKREYSQKKENMFNGLISSSEILNKTKENSFLLRTSHNIFYFKFRCNINIFCGKL